MITLILIPSLIAYSMLMSWISARYNEVAMSGVQIPVWLVRAERLRCYLANEDGPLCSDSAAG